MFSRVGRALVLAAMLAGLVVFVRVFIGAPLNWLAVTLDMAAMAVPTAGLLWLRQRLEAGLPLAPMAALVDPLLDVKQHSQRLLLGSEVMGPGLGSGAEEPL